MPGAWIAQVTCGQQTYLGCAQTVVGAARIYNDYVSSKGLDLPLNDLAEVALRAAEMDLDIPPTALQLEALAGYVNPVVVKGNPWGRGNFPALYKRNLVAIRDVGVGLVEISLTDAGRRRLATK